MWIRRSHVLAPLEALTSKTTMWKWGPEQQETFDTMKKIISREVHLAYPDFNDEFVIHTDASHTQLGAVISQKGKPIAFYSRKLKAKQTRYTTTEREPLSIVETLKEFRNILLGQKLVVHTDNKNLTCKNFNTERVMQWRLILEEFRMLAVSIGKNCSHMFIWRSLSQYSCTGISIVRRLFNMYLRCLFKASHHCQRF
jgi:hypothetical protein